MPEKSGLTVRLKRSLISEKPRTRAVAAGLGLRKPGDQRRHRDDPTIRGMLAKVAHLVEVERD